MNPDSINDGGPAFPHDDRAVWGERTGMTLRDYFAAKAMAGAIAARGERGNDVRFINEAELANGCYRMADAMLAAREEA